MAPTSLATAHTHDSNPLRAMRQQVLETAMALPGVRTALTPQQRARQIRRTAEPTMHERASLFLLMAEVLSRLSKLPDAPEAKKVPGWPLDSCVGWVHPRATPVGLSAELYHSSLRPWC